MQIELANSALGLLSSKFHEIVGKIKLGKVQIHFGILHSLTIVNYKKNHLGIFMFYLILQLKRVVFKYLESGGLISELIISFHLRLNNKILMLIFINKNTFPFVGKFVTRLCFRQVKFSTFCAHMPHTDDRKKTIVKTQLWILIFVLFNIYAASVF